MKQARLHFIAKLFKDRDEWAKNLLNIKNFQVLKMPRVLQSAFYLLGYRREDICEKGTNKFFWKQAKNHVNEQFIQRMVNYFSLGPKEQEFERYQTLNFIEKNVEGITTEEVDAYNVTLGKVFKWVLLALQTRKSDILRRKVLNLKERENRTAILDAIDARKLKLDAEIQEAAEKFKEDHKDEIEAAVKYEQMVQDKQEDEYGDEEEGEDDEKP